MSLRDQFNAAAISIFDSFGDLIEDVTLSQPGAWNPVTETQTPTVESIRVSRKEFSRAEQMTARGGNAGRIDIMDGDLEALAIKSEVTLTPKIDDVLTMDGVDYLVRGVGNIQEILWRLHLRRV